MKKRKYNHDDDDDEDEEEDGRDMYNPNNRKTGTKKRRVFYEKEYPNLLRLETQVTSNLCLHQVQYTLRKENASYKYRHYRPQEEDCSVGILTSGKLPVFDQFDLYPPSGQYQAEVVCNRQVSINSERMSLIRNFHDYVLNSVWKINTNMSFHSGDLLLVPLRNNDIDVDLLKLFSDVTEHRLHLELNCDMDSVIFPGYKEKNQKKENYFIEEFVPSRILTVTSQEDFFHGVL